MVDPGHIPAEAPAASRRSTRAVRVLAPVLAVVGLVLAFLPAASFVAGLPALAAIVLAIVLLVLGSRRLIPALSVLVAVVAVVVAVVVSVGQVGQAVNRFAERLPELDDPPSPSAVPSGDGDLDGQDAQVSVDPLSAGRHRITYEVLGTGAAGVAYTTLVGGSFGASDEPAVDAPHRRTQQVTVVEEGRSARFSMVVSPASGADGALGCRISIDGEVISERPAPEEEDESPAVANCVVEAR